MKCPIFTKLFAGIDILKKLVRPKQGLAQGGRGGREGGESIDSQFEYLREQIVHITASLAKKEREICRYN